MVEYSCEKCGKVFSQKGHFTNHMNRKTPCKKVENKVKMSFTCCHCSSTEIAGER